MKDILLDENSDLDIINGDFVAGNSDGQNQELLLATDKGEWKENPTVGVGLFGFLNDEGPQELFREIREQFTADGMTVKELRVLPDNKIGIDAKY